MTALGTRVEASDAAAFVGRGAELALLEQFVSSPEGPAVALVWGEGGVGKSALLREVRRRATRAGHAVHHIDAAALPTAADQLDDLIHAFDLGGQPVLLIDSFEHIAVLADHLRRVILPAIPAAVRVVLAGRLAPDRGWRADGWSAACIELPLSPLEDDDARELLARQGVRDAEMADAVMCRAQGLPLALTIGAQSVLRPVATSGGSPGDLDAEMADALLHHIVGAELRTTDREVLAVAAVAQRCDVGVLGAAIPGIEVDRAEAWLRGQSFVELAGSRLVMHERVRAALRAELRREDPRFERELRRRVVDNLHDRALLGESWLMHEIVQLIEDPNVRWGLGEEAGDGLSSDRVRPGDSDVLAAAVAPGGPGWWPGVERWLVEAPDHVVVVRQGDVLAGAGIVATPAWVPDWAADDLVLGPWLDHAARTSPSGDVMFLREAFDLYTPPGADRSAVIAIGNAAALRRVRMTSPRYFYGHIDPAHTKLAGFLASIGYEPSPELDVVERGRKMRTYILDYGPGGVIGAMRDLVYHDLGMTPPPRLDAVEFTTDAVRDALRSFHDPSALSRSPLAVGASTAERAAAVRTRITRAVEVTFGDSPDERLHVAVLTEGYLLPDGGHARAARVLHLSRSTYYRRLATATDRLALQLVAIR